MYLFVDSLSFPAYAALFDAQRTLRGERRFDVDGRENDRLLDEIETLLTEGKISWKDLEGIVVVVGPGGFTGTRLVTLLANTVGWAIKTPLHAINVFDMCALSGAPFPYFARANRNEYLVQTEQEKSPILVRVSELPFATYCGPANPLDFLPQTLIISGIDYAQVIRKIDLSTPQERLIPSYAKAPNVS